MGENEKKALAAVGLCIICVFIITIFVIQFSVTKHKKEVSEEPPISEMEVVEGVGSEKFEKMKKPVMSVAEADAYTRQNKLDQTNSEEIDTGDYNWIEKLYDNNPVLRPYINVFYKSGEMITEVENRLIWDLYDEKVSKPADAKKLQQAKKELEALKNKLGTKLQERGK